MNDAGGDLLGFVAGMLTTAAFAPQLIRALRTKRTGDISLSMLICVTIGMTLWLVHGVRIGDAALVLSNSASLAQAVPLLILKLRNDGWGPVPDLHLKGERPLP
jgi:MtN3 and saliva related transmembrane protein